MFDIMQGVSINFFIKTGKKNSNELGQIYHHDLYGKREFKYKFLNENTITSIPYLKLHPSNPNFFFVKKDLYLQNEIDSYFSINDLLKENSLGYLTKKDKFIIDFSKETIKNKLIDLADMNKSDTTLAQKYDLALFDNDKWNLNRARVRLDKDGIDEDLFKLTNYRCFDKRYIYYHNDFVARRNTRVLGNINDKDNFSLISVRQLADNNFHHIFISNLTCCAIKKLKHVLDDLVVYCF